MCVCSVLGREKNIVWYSLHGLLFALQGCMFHIVKNRLNLEGVGGQQPREKATLAIRLLIKFGEPEPDSSKLIVQGTLKGISS